MMQLTEKRSQQNGLTLIEFVDRHDRVHRKEFYSEEWKLHHDGGPARICYEGRKIELEEWYQNGELFREEKDKPVIVQYFTADKKKWIWKESFLIESGLKRVEYDDKGEIDKIRYLNEKNVLHREDGPAIVRYWRTGKAWEELWVLNGKKHREDGPAYIEWSSDGEINKETWWFNNKKHREGGPAQTEWLASGISKEIYYQLGQRHREDGPAVLNYCIGRLKEEIWYRHGNIHREDGPAYTKYKEERDINIFSENPENLVVFKEEYYMFGDHLKSPIVDFPGIIKEIRRKRNWTVGKLAEMCQVSPRTVEGWEQGREPKNFILLMNLVLLHFGKKES